MRFYKIIVTIIVFSFSQVAIAQDLTPADAKRLYEKTSKLAAEGNHDAALYELKTTGGKTVMQNDSLLYLKIKFLDRLYKKNNAYSRELDSSLQTFMRRVNRYTFPELKYSEVASIESAFRQFKDQDKIFFDTVGSQPIPELLPELSRQSVMLTNYLQKNSNSYYHTDLTARLSAINKRQQKIVKNASNQSLLKKMAKANVLTAGISFSNSGGSFPGFVNYNEAKEFFKGKELKNPGLEYSANISLFGAHFNLYTGSRLKAGIVWNILDAEYSSFNWRKDTLISPKTLRSIKGGTRIGPMVTVLITKSIAASVYYQARPGVQFLLEGPSWAQYKTDGSINRHSLSAEYQNFNLSHEVGMRLYFSKRFFINPFIHMGEFNWKNKLKEDNGESTIQANQKFNLAGIRIGI